jgi:hypothetical protein
MTKNIIIVHMNIRLEQNNIDKLLDVIPPKKIINIISYMSIKLYIGSFVAQHMSIGRI